MSRNDDYGDSGTQNIPATRSIYNLNIPNVNYREALKDKPHMIKYIDQLHGIINSQNNILNKIQSALSCPINVEQTAHTSQQYIKSESPSSQWVPSAQLEPASLVDQVKEAAETAVHSTNFVYEPISGMYFDYATGYYYDSELCLYYDGNSGCYYKYDQDQKEFAFHSHISDHKPKNTESQESQTVENNSPNWNGTDFTNGNGNMYATIEKPPQVIDQDNNGEISQIFKHRRPFRSSRRFSEPEEGECTNTSSDSSCDSVDAVIENTSTVGHPAMRLIVIESDNAKIKVGTLFLITCNGGTLGREGAHDIILPDINISKTHLKITYAKVSKIYYAIDMGSRNGTFLNGERMCGAQTSSTPIHVTHGSILQMAGIKLLCHVHIGNETCMQCEPGVVQSEMNSREEEMAEQGPRLSKTDMRQQHKKELMRIKKQYGLESEFCLDRREGSNSTYVDRAQTRRGNTKIDNLYAKTVVASMDESISSENKGFKLLSKMGWKSGETLGQTGQGLKEPIPLVSNPGTSGLGLSMPNLLQVDPMTENKRAKWKKAQKRFNQCGSTTIRPWSEDQEQQPDN